MAEHDKIEPFWARTTRAKRRAAAQLDVPARADTPPAPATPVPPPADMPQEPSFPVSRQARRETIAAIIADAGPAAPDAPAPPIPSDRAQREAPSFGPAPAEPAPEPGPDGWVKLSPAEAVRHPLFGVQGWLIAIGVLIVLGLARALVELIDFWATTDHGGLAAWIMAVLRSGMALWAALLLGLLIGRSRAFPTSFVAYGMVNVVYLTLFGLAFAHVTHNRVFTGVAVGIAVTLLAIAYVLRSRRVNVTYRHRIRIKKRAEAPPPADSIEASHA